MKLIVMKTIFSLINIKAGIKTIQFLRTMMLFTFDHPADDLVLM